MGEYAMSLPNIGQVIRMQQLIEDDTKVDRIYKTRVADINQDYITMELPIAEHNGTPMYLPIDTQFMVTYMDQNGNNFHFRTKLLARKEENIPLILVTTPNSDDILKSQKRGFFRVEANLDIAVSLNRSDRRYHIITKTVDIGGGGISFMSPLEFKFEIGDQLQLWCVVNLNNNQIKRITFSGEVVRVHLPDRDIKKQMISIKFMDLKESDNVSIIRYCFERQIELHKKLQIE